MNRTARLALLLTCLATACDDSPSSDALRARAEAIVAAGAVGVQAVSHGSDGDHAAVAGLARLDDDSPLAANSPFRIASTTKTFVAAAILQLVEAGTLRLDDTIEAWLPGVVSGNRNRGDAITLRHLLQHRSGLANHVDDQVATLVSAGSLREVQAILARTWTARELVALAVAHPPSFAPGGGWAYTDTGYVLLGMILEAATGETWQARVKRGVLEPLHLDHSFAPAADPAIPGHPMHGYAMLPGADELQDVTFLNPSSLDAAGAIVSTPADVQVVFRALVRGELVGGAMLAEMQRTVDVGDGAHGYGLGLAQATAACGASYWTHDGDTLGTRTRTGVTGDGERSVVLAISGDADVDELAGALIDDVICGRL